MMQPDLASDPLVLLLAGTELQIHKKHDGFVCVRLHDNQLGFLPMAVIGQSPPDAPAQRVRLNQPTTLSTIPLIGRELDSNILTENEDLEIIATHGRFMQIRTADQRMGFVPTLLLNKPGSQPGRYRLRQPVRMYDLPAPGGQRLGGAPVVPEERLLRLGVTEGSVLVQREDGQIGFVRLALTEGAGDPEAILVIGRVDLGWIVAGTAWATPNLLAVAQLIAYGPLIPELLHPYVLIGLTVAAAVGCFLHSRQRPQAYGFGIGILLTYLALIVQRL
jgi:hypothetical protein